MKKIIALLLVITGLFVFGSSLSCCASNVSESVDNKVEKSNEKVLRDIKITSFIASNRKYFPENKLIAIRSILNNLNDYELEVALNMDFTHPAIMILISFFFGEFGIDRFIEGDICKGIFKLITGGGFGIMWLYDVFTVAGRTKRANYEYFLRVLSRGL